MFLVLEQLTVIQQFILFCFNLCPFIHCVIFSLYLYVLFCICFAGVFDFFGGSVPSVGGLGIWDILSAGNLGAFTAPLFWGVRSFWGMLSFLPVFPSCLGSPFSALPAQTGWMSSLSSLPGSFGWQFYLPALGWCYRRWSHFRSWLAIPSAPTWLAEQEVTSHTVFGAGCHFLPLWTGGGPIQVRAGCFASSPGCAPVHFRVMFVFDFHRP